MGLLLFPAAGAMHRSRREVSLVENELDQREAHLLWALPAPLRPPLPPVNLVHANTIITMHSLPTLRDANTAYPCFLHRLCCPVLQRMVKNYKRGVRDGQPVEYGSWRHTDPSRVLTVAQPIKRGQPKCVVQARENGNS